MTVLLKPLLLAAGVCFCLLGARAEVRVDALGYEHDLTGPEWTVEDRNTWLGNVQINQLQPGTVPSFTKEGFKKARMPAAIFAMVDEHIQKHKSKPSYQEEPVTGYMNNRGKSPTYMHNLPWTMTQKINELMMPVLQEWVGPDKPLEHTSTYGIREYTNGSVLQVHVDVVKTHAVSAILNVGQDNIREPWPLAIADHAGKTHEVLMEPGDMVLYESAKLIHGRPKALQGDRYFNVFVHSAPKTGYQEHHQDWREDAKYKGGEL